MSLKLWRGPAERNCLLLLSLQEEYKDKRYRFKTHRMKCFFPQCLSPRAMGLCRLTEYMGQVSCYICIFLMYFPRCPFLIPAGSTMMGCLSLWLELARMFPVFVQSSCTLLSCVSTAPSDTAYWPNSSWYCMHGEAGEREVWVKLVLFLPPVLGKSILQQAWDQLHLWSQLVCY